MVLRGRADYGPVAVVLAVHDQDHGSVRTAIQELLHRPPIGAEIGIGSPVKRPARLDGELPGKYLAQHHSDLDNTRTFDQNLIHAAFRAHGTQKLAQEFLTHCLAK